MHCPIYLLVSLYLRLYVISSIRPGWKARRFLLPHSRCFYHRCLQHLSLSRLGDFNVFVQICDTYEKMCVVDKFADKQRKESFLGVVCRWSLIFFAVSCHIYYGQAMALFKQKISANQTTTTVLTDNRLCQQMPLILSPTTMPYTAPSLANVPPPPRATFMSLNRPIPLLATTSSAYNILPPNPNGISCCNCAGRHPFQYCPQQTMLQVVANGKLINLSVLQ